MAIHGGRSFMVGLDASQFLRSIDKFEKQIDKKYRAFLIKFAVRLNDKLLANTPVWEGTVIRNWRWSVSAPARGVLPPEGDAIPPGPTNTMAIGAEPRRAANVSAQKEDFTRFLGQLATAPRIDNIFLRNNAPHALELEYGQLPSPSRSRTPSGGVLRLAVLETLTAMGAR